MNPLKQFYCTTRYNSLFSKNDKFLTISDGVGCANINELVLCDEYDDYPGVVPFVVGSGGRSVAILGTDIIPVPEELENETVEFIKLYLAL